jgi:hypothetical protein
MLECSNKPVGNASSGSDLSNSKKKDDVCAGTICIPCSFVTFDVIEIQRYGPSSYTSPSLTLRKGSFKYFLNFLSM